MYRGWHAGGTHILTLALNVSRPCTFVVPRTLSVETSGSQFSVGNMEAFGLCQLGQWDLVCVQMLNCCILLFILPFSFNRGKPAPPENLEYSNAFCLGLAVSQPASLLGNDSVPRAHGMSHTADQSLTWSPLATTHRWWKECFLLQHCFLLRTSFSLPTDKPPHCM